MATQTPTVSQNRSFSTVFLIEMWERFGYYGMQAVLTYYMVQRLGFTDDKSNLVWGAFAALVYITPAIGGWVGDKVLGTRRSMVTGAVILAAGYALLSVPTDDQLFLYGAMAVIAVGNGLFKPNAGNLVRKIYEGDDSRIDSAFTIYYMAVNVGSTISLLLTPWIRDYVGQNWGDELGWHAAFAACSAGLVVGLANYAFMRRTLRHIGSPMDHQPMPWGRFLAVLAAAAVLLVAMVFVLQSQPVSRWCVYLAGVAVLGIFVYLIATAAPGERAGLGAALLLTLQVIFFFVFYQQMPTSLSLFALRNVDWNQNLFGIHLFTWKPGQYQALNAIWIMLLSVPLAWAYTALGKRGRDLPIAAKFALGFALVALGFFLYGASGSTAVDGKVSSWYLIWGYGCNSLGELLVSGLGLAMIARYVPERMGGFMMGAYFVANGIAQYLGSVAANLASVPKDITDPMQTLPIYTGLFTKLGFAGVGCTAIAVALLPVLKKLSASHAQSSGTPLPAVHSEG
jgi:POT family proton-dependent oligopeptide transporter